jgi:hypothetical protein
MGRVPLALIGGARRGFSSVGFSSVVLVGGFSSVGVQVLGRWWCFGRVMALEGFITELFQPRVSRGGGPGVFRVLGVSGSA